MLASLKLPALLMLAALAATQLSPRPAAGDPCCGESVAACNGATPCKVCTNCSRCKHCKGSGKCGTCSSGRE